MAGMSLSERGILVDFSPGNVKLSVYLSVIGKLVSQTVDRVAERGCVAVNRRLTADGKVGHNRVVCVGKSGKAFRSVEAVAFGNIIVSLSLQLVYPCIIRVVLRKGGDRGIDGRGIAVNL